MIKRVTIQFDVEIPDELLAEGILNDEDVVEQLKEAYNDYIRTDGCSDATIKIETVEKIKTTTLVKKTEEDIKNNEFRKNTYLY